MWQYYMFYLLSRIVIYRGPGGDAPATDSFLRRVKTGQTPVSSTHVIGTS